MENFFNFFLFLITATANSAVQLLLKRASLNVASILSADYNWLVKIVKIFFNPHIITVGLLMLTTIIIWLKVISQWELSRAYPINIALTIIITFIASVFFFNESVTTFKIVGIVLVISGLWFIIN